MQCSMCKKTFDDSTMWKSKVYYDITKGAEESRKKGRTPFEFRPGIVNIIDQLQCSEEKKQAMRHDLDHNYELRTLSYCEKCAPVANFMQLGPK
jgi:hypothetical protein